MLNFLAKIIYKIHRPKIILVSGTSGKTQTISLIYHIVQDHYKVYKTSYHQNHQKGILLTFFLSKKPSFGYNFFRGLKLIFSKQYPEYLILEFGLEKPNIIENNFSWLQIDYLIITSLGKIPAFLEYFAGPESLLKEYQKLFSILKEDAKIFLNGDDYTLLEIKEKSKKPVITFGLQENNDITAKNISIICNPEQYLNHCGTRFDIYYQEKLYPVFLKNLFGKGLIYASLVSFLVAKELNIDFKEIVRDIESFPGLPGRGILLKTKKGAFILDESAHASLASVQFALQNLQQMPVKRKIFVLGDLLHLGEYSFEAHSLIGKQANFVDYFFGFGIRAQVSVDKAIEAGLDIAKTQKILHTDKEKLITELTKVIQPDDFILITGDRELNLHEIVHLLKELA